MRRFIGTISLVLVFLIGKSQNNSTSTLELKGTTVKPTGYLVVGSNQNVVLTYQTGSDTIEVTLPLKIHYIRIGSTVYQITEHEPTLDKVDLSGQQLFRGIYTFPSGINPFVVPAGTAPLTWPSGTTTSPNTIYLDGNTLRPVTNGKDN